MKSRSGFVPSLCEVVSSWEGYEERPREDGAGDLPIAHHFWIAECFVQRHGIFLSCCSEEKSRCLQDYLAFGFV